MSDLVKHAIGLLLILRGIKWFELCPTFGVFCDCMYYISSWELFGSMTSACPFWGIFDISNRIQLEEYIFVLHVKCAAVWNGTPRWHMIWAKRGKIDLFAQETICINDTQFYHRRKNLPMTSYVQRKKKWIVSLMLWRAITIFFSHYIRA